MQRKNGEQVKLARPNGYIFGLNPIDFLALLFIICLLPIFYFGYKILTQPKVVVEKPPTITLDKAEYEELKRLKIQISNYLKENKRARRYFK